MLRRATAMLASFFAPKMVQSQKTVAIDLVTEHPQTGRFSIVLVETGPWQSGAEEDQLRRLQARLYDCVDVAVDGQLAAKYPASRGRPVRIQLDTYDLPEAIVRPFFDEFADHIASWAEVQDQIRSQQHVQSLEFGYNPRFIDGHHAE
jgi:hypothetical protein